MDIEAEKRIIQLEVAMMEMKEDINDAKVRLEMAINKINQLESAINRLPSSLEVAQYNPKSDGSIFDFFCS